jgi:hypothetical protein
MLPKEIGMLACAAKLLSRLDEYAVVLVPLATEKKIGCSTQGCPKILTIASPDDKHTFFTVEKPDGESVPKEYECENKHITKGYWSSQRVFLS